MCHSVRLRHTGPMLPRTAKRRPLSTHQVPYTLCTEPGLDLTPVSGARTGAQAPGSPMRACSPHASPQRAPALQGTPSQGGSAKAEVFYVRDI